MSYTQIQLLTLASNWKHPLKNVSKEFSRSVSQRGKILCKLLCFDNVFHALRAQGELRSGLELHQETAPAGTIKNQEGRSLFFLNFTVRRSRRRYRFPAMYSETLGVSMTTKMNRENTVSLLPLRFPQLHMSPRSRNQIHRKSQSKGDTCFF